MITNDILTFQTSKYKSDKQLKTTKISINRNHLYAIVSYHPKSKEIEFFIEDTGQGIPKDELSMVFSRFYKRDIFSPGVGLGLSVCKTIVDKLKGRLSASSEVGKGSRFSVYLRGEGIIK